MKIMFNYNDSLKKIKYLIILFWLIILALSVVVRGLPKTAEPVSGPVVGEVMEGRSVLVTANGRLEMVLEV